MKLPYKELKLFLFHSQSLAASKEDSELFWGIVLLSSKATLKYTRKLSFFLVSLCTCACLCVCVRMCVSAPWMYRDKPA